MPIISNLPLQLEYVDLEKFVLPVEGGPVM